MIGILSAETIQTRYDHESHLPTSARRQLHLCRVGSSAATVDVEIMEHRRVHVCPVDIGSVSLGRRQRDRLVRQRELWRPDLV